MGTANVTPSGRFAALVIVLAAIISSPELAATPTHSPEAVQVGTVGKLHVLDRCYLASQPAAEDFALFKEKGVTTVVNFRAPGELKEFDEQKVVESLGMRYVHIPIAGPEALTPEVLDRARKVFDTEKGGVLVHCASANRVGAVWLAHRVLDDGLPWDRALAEAKQIGLTSPALEQRAKEYVEARRR